MTANDQECVPALIYEIYLHRRKADLISKLQATTAQIEKTEEPVLMTYEAFEETLVEQTSNLKKVQSQQHHLDLRWDACMLRLTVDATRLNGPRYVISVHKTQNSIFGGDIRVSFFKTQNSIHYTLSSSAAFTLALQLVCSPVTSLLSFSILF